MQRDWTAGRGQEVVELSKQRPGGLVAAEQGGPDSCVCETAHPLGMLDRKPFLAARTQRGGPSDGGMGIVKL
eukprot:1158409-Pelagomonas_calceolata.AAC.4